MNRSVLLFFILYLIPSCAYSKNPRIDSVYKIIERSYTEGDIDQKILLKNITDLYYLSKETKYHQGQLYAIFEDSRINYINGHFNDSLIKIKEGLDLAKSEKNYNMLCRLLLIYQRVLLQLDYFKESREILDKCKYYNNLTVNEDEKRINNSFILLSEADLLGELGQSNLTLIISLKKKSYDTISKLKDSNKFKKATLIYVLESLALSITMSGNSKEAKEYTTTIDKLLVNYPNKNFIIQNLKLKGIIEDLDKNYPQAINYFSQAISLAKSDNNNYRLYETYLLISQSYSNLKDFEKANSYAWKHKKLSDSIDLVKKMSGEVSLISHINNSILNKEEKSFVSTYFYLVLAGVLLLCGLLSIFIISKRKNRKKIQIPESPLHSLIPNNATQENILKAEEHDIDKKQSFENEIIIEDKGTNYITSILESKTESDPELTKNLIDLAKKDINAFYVEFQKAYPTFSKTLKEKYPDLNISDINFCSLIKMNFGIKQISVFTNASLRSVESRRYRIMKKMEIKSQNDLYLNISRIK